MYTAPQIITSGLVLSLDAANPKSYPGTGTTWYDRAGNLNAGVVNNGTLVNEPIFDSGNGGSIVFDGVNDYANLGNVASTIFSHTSPWSVQFTAKIISYVNTFPGFMVKGPAAVSGVLVFYANNGNMYWKHNNVNIPITTLVPNRIYTITFTYAGSGNISAYINGNFVISAGTMVSTDSSSPLYLGSGDQYGNSGLYSFLKYNKSLTPEEVSQNYNAARTRFGL